MSARLKKSFGFYTGLIYQSQFLVNHWNVNLDLVTVSDDGGDHNIAYERMKYWIGRVLDDSILIGHTDPALEDVSRLNGRVIVLPDEPVDQIVGIMLYLKLNAIMENRIVVAATEIWSTQGDQTSYIHTAGENLGPDLGQDGWWSDPRPIWSTSRSRGTGRVVSLDRAAEWKDHGLGWESNEPDASGNVVVAQFPRNEDQ